MPMLPDPISLVTRRIQLRPVSADDAAALLTLFQTPYVRRYLFDDTLVEMDAVVASIAASEAMFKRLGLGLWGLFRPAQSSLIGFCGFIAEDDEPRLIYGLSEAEAGKGLAREAAAAVIAYAMDRQLQPIRASVDSENGSSRALLEALGFVIVHASGGRLGDVLIYELRI